MRFAIFSLAILLSSVAVHSAPSPEPGLRSRQATRRSVVDRAVVRQNHLERRVDPSWNSMLLIWSKELQNIMWNYTSSTMYLRPWAEMAQLEFLPHLQWVGKWLWPPLHHHPGYASLHMLKYFMLDALPSELLHQMEICIKEHQREVLMCCM